jgi:hypothetical protein
MADKKKSVIDALGLLFIGKKAMITPRSLMIGDVMVDENNFEIL